MDGLDHERDVVTMTRGARARAASAPSGASRAAGAGGRRVAEQAALVAHRGGEALQRALHQPISAKAAAAASSVRSRCAAVCASDGNQASNCDGGG